MKVHEVPKFWRLFLKNLPYSVSLISVTQFVILAGGVCPIPRHFVLYFACEGMLALLLSTMLAVNEWFYHRGIKRIYKKYGCNTEQIDRP